MGELFFSPKSDMAELAKTFRILREIRNRSDGFEQYSLLVLSKPITQGPVRLAWLKAFNIKTYHAILKPRLTKCHYSLLLEIDNMLSSTKCFDRAGALGVKGQPSVKFTR
jgi:hypothetical protein